MKLQRTLKRYQVWEHKISKVQFLTTFVHSEVVTGVSMETGKLRTINIKELKHRYSFVRKMKEGTAQEMMKDLLINKAEAPVGNIYQYSIKKNESTIKRRRVSDSDSIAEFAKSVLYSDDIEVYESLWLITLNIKLEVVGFVKLSQGGTSGTTLDPRLLLSYLVGSLADRFVLVHNHPSGDVLPSKSDEIMTKRIYKIAQLIEVELLDHIIVSKVGHFSFEDSALLLNYHTTLDL